MNATNQQWWLEPGAENCPFCSVQYHVEAAYYCVECDRPVCPTCFIEIHVTRRVYCPACAPGETGS